MFLVTSRAAYQVGGQLGNENNILVGAVVLVLVYLQIPVLVMMVSLG